MPLWQANSLYCLAVVGLTAFGLWLSAPIVRLLQGMFPGMGPEALSLVVNALFYGVVFFLPAAWLTRRCGARERVRLKGLSPVSALLIAALALFGVLLANDVASLWSILLEELGLTFPDSSIEVASGRGGLVLQAVTIGMLPGICEELLCRGVLLSAWEEARGTRRAVCVSAFLFMTMHASITGAPSQFLLGWILGWLVVATDSLFAGMIFHTTYNVWVLVLAGWLSSMPVSPEEEALAAQSLFVQCGGWEGVITILIEAAMLGWICRMLLRIALRRKAAVEGWKPLPGRAEGIRMREVSFVIAGLAICALLYAADLWSMLGGGA